jgi:hypothetical protein
MYGQRRASIYDQVDESQVYNDIDGDTQVYELVDYTMLSNASVLAHSDQPAQQAQHRSKLAMYFKVFRWSFLILNIFITKKRTLAADSGECKLCLFYRLALYIALVLAAALIIIVSITALVITALSYSE